MKAKLTYGPDEG